MKNLISSMCDAAKKNNKNCVFLSGWYFFYNLLCFFIELKYLKFCQFCINLFCWLERRLLSWFYYQIILKKQLTEVFLKILYAFLYAVIHSKGNISILRFVLAWVFKCCIKKNISENQMVYYWIFCKEMILFSCGNYIMIFFFR